MVDLDGFKAINDTYGHIKGDQALKIFAGVLSDSIKNAKVIGRYGGDEFIIVFDELTDLEITNCQSKIKDKIDSINQTLPFDLKFSMGYQLWKPEEELTYEQLLNMADQSMYKNKNSE